MSDIETAIIGAGPYGLSLAAHLGERGRSFAVFGKPMESWRTMPTGMILKSEPMASNLWDPAGDFSFEQFSRAAGVPYQRCGAPLALDRFLAYAAWFQRRAVSGLRESYVINLRREADRRFALTLADGAIVKARRVVLATGHVPFASLPPALAGLPPQLVSHSVAVADPRNFAGRDVAIVGLGQSALETAALLHEAGARVRVFGRDPQVAWNGPPRPTPTLLDQLRAPDAGLGAGWGSYIYSEFPWAFRLMPEAWRMNKFRTSWGPAGAWWLKERVIGKIAVQTGTDIEEALETGGRVKLRLRSGEGASQFVADHVIACTGFELDFDRLRFVEAGLRARVGVRRGAPALSQSFETSVAGLYAVGLLAAPTFGPALRFMYGAKFAARTLARALAAKEANWRAGISSLSAALRRN